MAKKHVGARPTKIRRTAGDRRGSNAGGRRPNPTQPGLRELEGWLSKWLLQANRLAAGYCKDFQKSRKKNPQTAGIRARLETSLEKYSNWAEKLSLEFRNIPEEFHAVIAELEKAGGNMVWAASKQVAACIDRIHQEIERQKARIAAPMNEAEERALWANIAHVMVGLEKLQELTRVLRKAISERREDHAAEALKPLDAACVELCSRITQFGVGLRTDSPKSSLDRIRDVQESADFYRNHLSKLGHAIDQARETRRIDLAVNEKTLAVGIEELKSAIGIQVTLLDAVLFTNVIYVKFPAEACDAALEIQKIVADALRENLVLGARLGFHAGDQNACCDTLHESKLRDYATLSDKPKEHEQFRVVIDAMLMLLDSRGPNATMDRKQLQQAVEMLAGYRKVAGLATTSLWNKLEQLAGLHLVRKITAAKTKTNQNASDEYRLSIPAQKKFASHAAAVRAEFEHITALSPAADPLD